MKKTYITPEVLLMHITPGYLLTTSIEINTDMGGGEALTKGYEDWEDIWNEEKEEDEDVDVTDGEYQYNF